MVGGSANQNEQPEGAHYDHPIPASTPGFQNLTTALKEVHDFKIKNSGSAEEKSVLFD